jgi:hypothetical protein
VNDPAHAVLANGGHERKRVGHVALDHVALLEVDQVAQRLAPRLDVEEHGTPAGGLFEGGDLGTDEPGARDEDRHGSLAG